MYSHSDPSPTSFCHHRHKSQDMTLDGVCLHIDDREFARGLTFIATSLVRKLGHIAFKPAFDLERLTQVTDAESSRGIGMRQRWEDNNNRKEGSADDFDDHFRWKEDGGQLAFEHDLV